MEVENATPASAATAAQQAATPEGALSDEVVLGADLQPVKRPAAAERAPNGHLATAPNVCEVAVADRAAAVKKERCSANFAAACVKAILSL